MVARRLAAPLPVLRQVVDKRELTDVPFAELTAKYGIQGLPAAGRLFGLPQFSLSGRIGYQGLGEPGSMPNFSADTEIMPESAMMPGMDRST